MSKFSDRENMSQVIIYKQDNGVVAVVIPTAEALEQYTIDEIAKKDVPPPKTVFDVPTGNFEQDEETGEMVEVKGPRTVEYTYKIVDSTSLPDSPQEEWDFDLIN